MGRPSVGGDPRSDPDASGALRRTASSPLASRYVTPAHTIGTPSVRARPLKLRAAPLRSWAGCRGTPVDRPDLGGKTRQRAHEQPCRRGRRGRSAERVLLHRRPRRRRRSPYVRERRTPRNASRSPRPARAAGRRRSSAGSCSTAAAASVDTATDRHHQRESELEHVEVREYRQRAAARERRTRDDLAESAHRAASREPTIRDQRALPAADSRNPSVCGPPAKFTFRVDRHPASCTARS